jgi:toxin YoeB
MPYSVELSRKAKKHYLHWKKYNRHFAGKIDELNASIEQGPSRGIGHPEPLKYDIPSAWSRHISEERQLIYRVENDLVIILRCFGHYK